MSSASQPSVREIFAGPATREDGQLLWMLVGLVAVDIALAVYLGLFPIYAGFLYFTMGIMFGGAALNGAGLLRLKRHYSLAAIFWFITIIAIFSIWNLVVMWVSLLSRWWAASQPGYHIAISAIVGLVPLLIGIWLFARKLRQAS